MIDLYLYTYTGESNRLTKTLPEPYRVQGTLRDAGDIGRPAVEVAGDASTYNYMYIPGFGRYYYLDEPVRTVTGLTLLTGRVDVLMSFDTQIRACSTIAARTGQGMQNAYIPDTERKSYAYQTVRNRLLYPDPITYGATPRYILLTAG